MMPALAVFLRWFSSGRRPLALVFFAKLSFFQKKARSLICGQSPLLFLFRISCYVFSRFFVSCGSIMSSLTERISLIIGTAGHIDHGKTSLIRALTSIETDRLAEEKRRGLTIDLGFAYMDFEEDGRSYRAAIVDVPGHERFIRNMLAGVTGMDLVLFTVAADDGIMPQTLEHLDIIRLLGIEDVFFVITKCDLAEPGAVDAIERGIRDLVGDTPLAGSPFFRVSVKTGQGLPGLTEALRKRVLSMKGRRPGPSFFRLPVDRSFTIKGFGTVATGTVAGGALKKGGAVVVFPTGRSARARGIESMHMAADSVSRGERAAVNLSGLSRRDLCRGACLVEPALEPFLAMPPVVDCVFEFLERKEGARKGAAGVRSGGLIKVHHHAGEALARIRFAGGRRAGPGTRTRGRLFLKRPLLMMRGDAFILRDAAVNTTIGGGRVILSYPSRDLVPRFTRIAGSGPGGGGNGSGALQGAARLGANSDMGAPAPAADRGLSGTVSGDDAVIGPGGADAVAALLGPLRPGLEMKTLSLLLNVKENCLDDFLRGAGFFSDKGFYVREGFLISERHAREAGEEMKAILARRHREHPQEEGLSPDDIAGVYLAARKTRPEAASAIRSLLRVILDGLVQDGGLAARGPLLSLPGHEPGLRGPERAVQEKIAAFLEGRGLAVTKREEITIPGVRPGDIDKVLSHMKKTGGLVTLGRGAFISGTAAEEARKKCVDCIRAEGRITAARFRDILGTGRKLAILLLEHFDTIGLTLRKGDERTLR